MSLYELNDIVHHYDGHPVLTIDHWQVAADTMTGVVGPNGSGKSTLLKLLGFVERPVQGEIRLNGRKAVPYANGAHAKVVLLPQESFLLKRSVFKNVAYGLKIRGDRANQRSRVHQALAQVGLAPELFARRPWFALSGGEARRVALAARLILEPQVLLMDEPTAGVDAASAQLIKEAALEARRQWGTTLIVASHDQEWLMGLCDNLLYLFRGKILASGQQTLIFGPWQPYEDNTVCKLLTEGQRFLAPMPTDPNGAVAAIDARQMALYSDHDQIPAPCHGLQGQLLNLSFEKPTGRISAAVIIGRTVITVYLSKEEKSACRYGPGQIVWVGYDPSTVYWY